MFQWFVPEKVTGQRCGLIKERERKNQKSENEK
jgi:hypothetical protein